MIAGLVSIIVPVFNRAGPLAEAVASAVAQRYRPIEILIVDDGSTDETHAVAEALAAQHPDLVRVLSRANGGPGLARESGRQAARGELIQYLDSDDILMPAKLELQVAALCRRPECGIAYGITHEVDAQGVERTPAIRASNREIPRMFPAFVAERWWNTVSPLYRVAAVAAAGPWSDLRLEEDWEYDARVAALGLPLAYVPEVVALVRDVAVNRLSRGQALEVGRNRNRARAHLLILEHASGAGVHRECAEMARFARELFLLARQSGAAGLARESGELFAAARRASTPERAAGWDFRLYRLLAGALGWVLTARLAIACEALVRKRAG